MKPHEHILAALDRWCRETRGEYIYEQTKAEDVRTAYLELKAKVDAHLTAQQNVVPEILSNHVGIPHAAPTVDVVMSVLAPPKPSPQDAERARRYARGRSFRPELPSSGDVE